MKSLFLSVVLIFQIANTAKATEYVDPGFLEEDLIWLALNIYFEARNDDTVQGRLYVAQTVLNRVYSNAYPNTIKAVVTQHKQFSWYWDGKSDEPTDEKAFNDSLELAELALSTYNPSKSINGALCYHAWYVTPYWADDMEYIGYYGAHKFYR